MKKIRWNNRGNSLMMVMVAIGLTGILAVTISRMMGNSQKMYKKMSLDSEIEEVKRIFSQKIQCLASSCEELKQSIDNYHVGRWQFLGICEHEDMYVKTRKYLEDNKTPIQDPMSKKAMAWKPLFKVSDGFFCSVASMAPARTPAPEHVSPSVESPQPQTPSVQEPINPSPQAAPTAPSPQVPKLSPAMQEQIKALEKQFQCPEGQSIQGIDPETFAIHCE